LSKSTEISTSEKKNHPQENLPEEKAPRCVI